MRLEPLAMRHVDDLAGVALEEELWRYLPVTFLTREDVERWARATLTAAEGGAEIPFATIDRSSGRAIGSTRFMDIRREHRGAEIGWTWLGREWRRTAANSEAKYLQLSYLFETAGCLRVTLKTDALNTRSRRSIERLGAVFEGVLRKHMVMPTGRIRDSAYYSILDDEWPAVKERLAERLYGAPA